MQARSVDLEFILPVWNREHEVRDDLDRMASCLRRLSLPAAVAVVDRGSSDRTLERVDGYAGGSPVPVRTVGCSRAGWHAAALRGITSTPGRWVAFGEPPGVAELEHATRMLAAGCHVVRVGRASVFDVPSAEVIVRAQQPDGPDFIPEPPDTVSAAGLRIVAFGRVGARVHADNETTAVLQRVAV